MSARGVLDMDMRALVRTAARGWAWWVTELQGLVPERWRRPRHGALPHVMFQNGRIIPEGAGRATVVIPETLCLSRIITRPALGDRDLQRMLELEGDTLLPFPAGSFIIAGRSRGPATEPGAIAVEIAGLPIETAGTLATAIVAARTQPVRIVRADTRDDRVPIDFASAMRDAGLIAPHRSAGPALWAIVAFLAALNVGALIWRDAARVDRLDRLVREQQPAVAIAQTIARRMDRDQRLIARSAALRRVHDPLAALDLVGQTLPVGVWLQRYVWDGATVRLTGYRPARTDVSTALRRSGRFVGVRSMNDEKQATVPAGEPFDLTARIVAPRIVAPRIVAR